MSLPNLVPRGDLTGSLGSASKRWATGSFGLVVGDGTGLTNVLKSTGGTIAGDLVVTGNITGSYFTGSFVGDGANLTNINVAATPQGSNKSIQFNDASVTSGSSYLTFDKSLNKLSITGSLSLSGSLIRSTVRVNDTTYTIKSSDYRVGVAWTLSASVDIQLPLISDVGEIEFKIKDENGNCGINNINILASGSDLIDGQTTQSMATNYMSVGLYNDGTSNWFLE